MGGPPPGPERVPWAPFYWGGTRVTPLHNADWAAELLGGVSTDLVYCWVRSGLLPAVHIGRRVMFDERQVAEFIAKGGRPGTLRTGPDHPASSPRSALAAVD